MLWPLMSKEQKDLVLYKAVCFGYNSSQTSVSLIFSEEESFLADLR